MIKVFINDVDADLECDNAFRFVSLVELVKSQIDPDHMITAITVDGRELEEAEWSMTLGEFQGEQLQFYTGNPDDYVVDRLQSAPGVIRTCFFEFRDARKEFQDGDNSQGNQRLKVACDTLRAFFDWYGTLVQIASEPKRDKLDISTHVIEISETCQKICEQQLYQSWWALSESLEKDLEPQLDKLEDVCRRAARQVTTVTAC